MTQDYKSILLKFLTGNLANQTGNNIPIFNEEDVSANDIETYIRDNAGAGSYDIYYDDILQGKETTLSFLYGSISTTNRSFIVVLDEEMQPIQYIDSYSSGTAFGRFIYLNIDEDGRFYGIDTFNGTYRFLLLNNILLKMPSEQNYKVVLRQSYNLPNNIQSSSNINKVIKAVGVARYIILWDLMDSNKTTITATELKINVGEPNVWTDYSYNDTGYLDMQVDVYANWDSEGELDSLKTVGLSENINDSTTKYITTFTLSSGSLVRSRIDISTDYGSWVLTKANISGCVLNIDDVYMLLHHGKNTVIFKVGATLTKLFERVSSTYDMPLGVYKDVAPMKIKNGLVFFGYIEVQSQVGDMKNWDSIGFIEDDVVYKNTIETNASKALTTYLYSVVNNYNLFTMYDLKQEQSLYFQMVYNVNNYNGYPYESNESLIPNSGILYNEDDMILFARNLYNKSVYGNTTLSTMQIPNKMVNDISIVLKNLIGKTNKILVSDNVSFIKNIYETVYVNFYDELNIVNRNDIDNPIYNQNAASRLAMSTSTAGDYDSAKINKIRIRYADMTVQEMPVQATISNGVATFEFDIYTGFYINSIEFVSADGATVYLTLDNIMEDGYQTNKIYHIVQECYVE